MRDRTGHLSDEELAEAVTVDRASPGARHLASCDACRRRQDELERLRRVLADVGQSERQPAHDVVASAMLRVRLRRHGVSNANELLAGFASLLRGLADLFSLPSGTAAGSTRTRRPKDTQHE